MFNYFQPEDWDDEEDGEWTAPTIPNPEYKGPWKAKVGSVSFFQISVKLTSGIAYNWTSYIH